MPTSVNVIEDAALIVERLVDLGVSEEELRRAILDGNYASAACTDNDPPLFRGVTFWARTTRALREILLTKGFDRDDTAGFATTFNNRLNLAIVVVTGDENTGDPTRTPKSKYRKGVITAAAVENNASQLELFPGYSELPDVSGDGSGGRTTWALLVHRMPGADEIRAELSLPSRMSSDARVVEWAERIILQPIPCTPISSAPPTEPDAAIEVPVERLPDSE